MLGVAIRWLRLSSRARLMLIEAVLELGLARAQVALRPFRAVAATAASRGTLRSGGDGEAKRRDVAWAITAAAQDWPVLRELLNLDAMAAVCGRLRPDVPPGSADERLFRVDLPWALATSAFVRSLG